jgi:hypothetical protein
MGGVALIGGLRQFAASRAAPAAEKATEIQAIGLTKGGRNSKST